MIAAIILGRKGSVGFPDKNVTKVLGRPLSWYPMKAAMNCPEVDEVYLSTDDPRLTEIAYGLGVQTIERPAHLATSEALAEDAYLHAYQEIEARTGKEVELLILLFCNAATVSPEQMSEGIAALRKDPTLDSAITVSRYNMWSPLRARRIAEDGRVYPFVPFEAIGDPEQMNCDRDSQGDVWFADVALVVARPRNLLDLEHGVLPQRWMGNRIHPIHNEAGFDLDYEWQIGQVEWWLKKHGWTAAD
ncbi:acylneuraminate cytidylyltransferase family protein [Nisaea sediminum]|uniref:acylneuraminate cytidylyltransferase family protein n=1 Tax=Nisaea sediminum TaxID=2775867 RepID=UPI0018694C12|nr:cytidylyltransferase [Nisaea sediminum]